MSITMNKKAKINEARKNGEALKAKKKALRDSKLSSINLTKSGVKGKSLIPQAKRK